MQQGAELDKQAADIAALQDERAQYQQELKVRHWYQWTWHIRLLLTRGDIDGQTKNSLKCLNTLEPELIGQPH